MRAHRGHHRNPADSGDAVMSGRLSGQRAWVMQRLTAVLMALYLLYFGAMLVVCPPVGFEAWQAWWRSGFMAVASAFFLFALLLHAWVGGRDIVLDYIKPLGLRMALLFALGVFLLYCAFWTIRILLVSG